MALLPEVMAFITGVKRYRPEIVWSGSSWTHNIFRAYELIFWRRVGIRCESISGVDEKGDYFHQEFTFEARVARLETVVRHYVRVLQSVRVTVLEVVPTVGAIRPFPYVLAIAFDAFTASAAQTTSPKTFTHTVTGSNVWLNAANFFGSSGPTSASYNSVAMSLGSGLGTQNAANGYYVVAWWYLASPATGANTVSLSWSGGGNGFGYAASYSGVTNTDVGGSSSIEDAAGTTFNSSFTATGGGWVTWAGSGNGSLPTGVTTGTMRSTVGSQWCFADSNATVSAGSYSFGYTNSSGTAGSINGFEFGVSAGGGGATYRRLTLMGAGT